MDDEEELIIPVLGYLFQANINGTEGVGQIFSAGGIKV